MTQHERTRFLQDIDKALTNIAYGQHIIRNSLDADQTINERLWVVVEELKAIKKEVKI